MEEDEEEGKYDDGHTFKITANPVVPADSSDDSDGNPLESIDVMVKRRQLKRIRALEKQIMLNDIDTMRQSEMSKLVSQLKENQNHKDCREQFREMCKRGVFN